MYHTNRNDVIETSEDISDILGVHVAEENGQKVATLKVLLDPRKDFLAVKDFFVHLTNGINHRMIGPLTAVNAPADLPTVPAPVIETPLIEVPPLESATAPAPVTETASTAELSPDVSTGGDTDKSPAVTPPNGEKGN